MKFCVVLVALAALACTKKSQEDEENLPLPYELVADRMLDLAHPRGWIVNRYDNGELRKPGDSLLFTGIAMGVLDCTRGAIPETALIEMLTANGGGLVRHPGLPDEPVTVDGALGLYWGVAHRIEKCPETRQRWAGAMQLHATVADRYLEGIFQPMLQQVMADLGLSAPPSEEERGHLGLLMASWAFAVVQNKAAAYRIHLAWLTLDVVPAPHSKTAFCEAVVKAKMPLMEHFCGRPGLAEWVEKFEFNRFEFFHQRAVWESPDGRRDGDPLNTPALDYLVALDVLH